MQRMRTIVAIDQGTTSSRALAVDERGAIAAIAQKEFRQIFPQPGWVEHDAEEIAETQLAVTAKVIAEIGAANVAAIGITNQRETTVVWERSSGRPVANAIVWQDRRTADFCEELRSAGHEELFRQRTGLVLDPYFSGTKLRWLLDHVAGARTRASSGELAFGTIDSWLLWRLTNGAVHRTDATNASRTLLFNIHTGAWDDDLLDLLRIPRALLPEVRSTAELYGTTSCNGLPRGIPITAVAGDQQAALFGQRCTRPGMVKTTYGTGSFVVMNVGREPHPSEHRLLTTIAWRRRGETDFALEGSIFAGGAIVQWLRDQLGVIRSASEIEALARSVEHSDDVYFVPAFAGLGAPHWDATARGAIVGLTRGTTRAHIARAALDAIALQVAEVVDAMEQDSAIEVSEMRVDGGASVNDLLMQTQADVIGVPVVRSRNAETTALGAAFLAGIAVGMWSDEQVDALWQRAATFEPRISADERAARLVRWRRALERSKGWA